MAKPRIFVSSTCYDLSEIRDHLHSFIDSMGYLPVFSDKNDVFYHPDLHSHEACIKEIESCDIFILILGGRFGGRYVYDMDKSIVNAEYSAAKKLNIPIFTFLKREVHEDHRVFVRNKRENSKIYSQIEYPSIEKQETVLKIFDFLDEVRKSDSNNAYFVFEFSREITDILKKQLAGMFYDFLWDRKKKKSNERTNELLINLSLLGQKTEEIIENIYKKVDENSANEKINKLDLILNASKFWYLIFRWFNLAPPKGEKRIQELAVIDPEESWIEYMISKGNFMIKEFDSPVGKVNGLMRTDGALYVPIEAVEGELEDSTKKDLKLLEQYFKDFKSMDESDRSELLGSLV